MHGRAVLAVGVGEGASDGGAAAAAVEEVEAVAVGEATNGWAVPGRCLSLCRSVCRSSLLGHEARCGVTRAAAGARDARVGDSACRPVAAAVSTMVSTYALCGVVRAAG